MSESKQQLERFGYIVITGRFKILDYHKPIPEQIATTHEQMELFVLHAIDLAGGMIVPDRKAA